MKRKLSFVLSLIGGIAQMALLGSILSEIVGGDVVYNYLNIVIDNNVDYNNTSIIIILGMFSVLVFSLANYFRNRIWQLLLFSVSVLLVLFSVELVEPRLTLASLVVVTGTLISLSVSKKLKTTLVEGEI
jgi:hypothetical protein